LTSLFSVVLHNLWSISIAVTKLHLCTNSRVKCPFPVPISMILSCSFMLFFIIILYSLIFVVLIFFLFFYFLLFFLLLIYFLFFFNLFIITIYNSLIINFS